jgi:cytochrome c biogenesis factor
MKIKYETNIATFSQFLIISLLTLLNQIKSIIINCAKDTSECVGEVFTNTILFILTVIVFANIWILGYLTNDRRSPRLAILLISAELIVVAVALINAKHFTDILSLATSLIDIALAFWVILSSLIIVKNKGSRSSSRRAGARRRRR